MHSVAAKGLITSASAGPLDRGPEAVASFRRFVGDAVLVAHNAALDKTRLHLAEARAGVTFDNLALRACRSDSTGRAATTRSAMIAEASTRL